MAATVDNFVGGSSNQGTPTIEGASASGSDVLDWLSGAEKVVAAASGAVKIFNAQGQPATPATPATGSAPVSWWQKYGGWVTYGVLGLAAVGALLLVFRRR